MSEKNKPDEPEKKVAESLETDIAIFNSKISHEKIDDFIHQIKNLTRKNKNIYLILTTDGGDPGAAYRLVRFLKKEYKKFYLHVMGFCKSAGTLIALGADEIIFSDYGELGPLDVQVAKDDELITQSGLTLVQALTNLEDRAFNMFFKYFIKLKQESAGTITTKTAAEISCSIVTGVLAPIFSQIEPLRLGEVTRAMNIAIQYGNRMCENPPPGLISKLVAQYPSHGFVIDAIEASELFDNVRKSKKDEIELENSLQSFMRRPQKDDVLVIFSLGGEDNGHTGTSRKNKRGTKRTNESDKRKLARDDEGSPSGDTDPTATGNGKQKRNKQENSDKESVE